jgi:hypothetical protein
MSGGHFDYNQYRLEDLAVEVERLIARNGSAKERGLEEYGTETLERFQRTVKALRQVGSMLQRIDWLVSGDDGEESFKERWEEEKLDELI